MPIPITCMLTEKKEGKEEGGREGWNRDGFFLLFALAQVVFVAGKEGEREGGK